MSQNIFSPTATALQHLGHGLINDQSRQNILAITERLPILHEGGFECHFAADGKVDFAFPVSIKEQDKVQAVMALQQSNAAKGLHDEGIDQEKIENIWFEFDTSEEHFNYQPGIFFDTYLLHYYHLNTVQPSENYWPDSLNQLIPAMGTKQLTAGNLSAIKQCIDLLPGGYAAYIGIMKNRQDDLRLCVKFTDTDSLVAYIRQIGLTLTAEAEEKMARLGTISDIVMVDLDIKDGKASEHFGVEFHLSKSTDQEVHEQYFLGHLMEYGLCSANQAEYVLQWPQTEADTFIHRISHFKVSLKQGDIKSAKVYLQYIYATNLS